MGLECQGAWELTSIGRVCWAAACNTSVRELQSCSVLLASSGWAGLLRKSWFFRCYLCVCACAHACVLTYVHVMHVLTPHSSSDSAEELLLSLHFQRQKNNRRALSFLFLLFLRSREPFLVIRISIFVYTFHVQQSKDDVNLVSPSDDYYAHPLVYTFQVKEVVAELSVYVAGAYFIPAFIRYLLSAVCFCGAMPGIQR